MTLLQAAGTPDGATEVTGTPSLEERAYDAVLDWLTSGSAQPGDLIPLRELARQLGMSRTPVRTAVGRLHEQDMVAYHARVGFTVAVPNRPLRRGATVVIEVLRWMNQ